MNTPDLTNAHWFTASESSGQGACVEVAFVPGAVVARDSKDPDRAVLAFSHERWEGFIRGVNTDDLRP